MASSVVLPVSSIHKKRPVSDSVRKPSEAGFMSCASVVINKESSLCLHPSRQSSQGWTNYQKRTFTALKCSEAFHNTMMTRQMCQSPGNCCFAIIRLSALFIFRFVPPCVSPVMIFNRVFWIIWITLSLTRFVVYVRLCPFDSPFIGCLLYTSPSPRDRH